MSTSEHSNSPANSGRSRKRSLSGDLNMEDISSGSTFSQNIENIEGLTSLHADEQVLIVSIFSPQFLKYRIFLFSIYGTATYNHLF